MLDSFSIAVVIPAYKVTNHLEQVIITVPDFIDHIIVVDDKCPIESGNIATRLKDNNSKIYTVFHTENMGVGGAVLSGYEKAAEFNVDFIVKMDGDGQMDPDYLKPLLQPLLNGKADYTKGNRFTDRELLRSMPKVRLIGNSLLSFILKLCSGYWNVMDPTNGYTAIRTETASKLNRKSVSKRYFFESDMLVHLNIQNAVVKDVPMTAIYGDEESSLNVGNILRKFPLLLIKRFLKRIFLKYYVYDFNMASVYILLGVPLFLFGVFFGSVKWIQSVAQNEVATTGTVMLSVLPIILGIQFILQAIQIDINAVPTKKG
ncbi:MAG: glycosyltransferase family 2 protein [Flavobacteriales bacterium]